MTEPTIAHVESRAARPLPPTDLLLYLICALTLFGLPIIYLKIMHLPLQEKLTYLSDDGFYYLVLARNFSELGQWTFDRGVSLTSGFHLLFGYLLVLFHQFFRDNDSLLQTALWLQLLAFSGAMVLVTVAARSLKLPAVLLSFCLLAVSSSTLSAWASIVEWPFVILFAAMLAYLYRCKPNAHWLWFFAAGMLGSLSRSDFGLWPLSITVASVLTWQRHRDRALIRGAASALAGAAAGVALTLLHTYLTTGLILQGSAIMKSLWTEVGGKSVWPILVLVQSILPGTLATNLPSIKDFSLAVVSLFLAAGLLLSWRHLAGITWATSREPLMNGIMVAASLLATSLYMVLYVFGSMGIAYWYTANFMIPLTIIFSLPVHFLIESRRLKFAFLTLALLVVTFQLSVFWKLPHGMYTWHPVVLEAAEYINEHLPGKRIACWGSGIVGYYAGQKAQIVNVDGLVNNDVYAFARQGKFMEYLSSRHIDYVSDWPEHIPSYARLSGNLDERFEKSIEQVKTFEDHYPQQELFTGYTIYRFKPEAVSQ